MSQQSNEYCLSSDEESDTYSPKISNLLINQLETKLQSFKASQDKYESPNKRENKSFSSREATSHKYNLDHYIPYISKTVAAELYNSNIGDDKEIKSTNELDEELLGYEQRIKKFQIIPILSINQQSPPKKNKNNIAQQTESLIIDQTKVSDSPVEARSPIFYEDKKYQNFSYQAMDKQFQESTSNKKPSQHNQSLYISEQTSPQFYGQQQQFFNSLNQKLLQIQNSEEQKCSSLKKKLQILQIDQQAMLRSRENLYRQQNDIKSNMIQMNDNYQNQLQSFLKQESDELFQEFKNKLSQIKEQSESHIFMEINKSQSFQVQVKQMREEKLAIMEEIKQQNIMFQQKKAEKQDIQIKLNNLINVHNQFLQNDMKKATQIIQTPRKSGNQIISPQPNLQIDYLYKLNIQLKEQMESQLNMIRKEIMEQKEINKELLQVFRQRQSTQITNNKDHHNVEHEPEHQQSTFIRIPNFENVILSKDEQSYYIQKKYQQPDVQDTKKITILNSSSRREINKDKQLKQDLNQQFDSLLSKHKEQQSINKVHKNSKSHQINQKANIRKLSPYGQIRARSISQKPIKQRHSNQSPKIIQSTEQSQVPQALQIQNNYRQDYEDHLRDKIQYLNQLVADTLHNVE